MLPLRAFLGLTFVYAGLQKLSDPGFLTPGSSTYIGSQLQSYAVHSPIGFILTDIAIPLGPLTGVGVMLSELAIGLLVLAGIYTRWAAAAGALLNFVLFLTASWEVQPYFLGSDSIYTVAWITLALLGDQGLYTARTWLGAAAARPPTPTDLQRRRLLFGLGAGAVAAVWALALLPRGRLSAAPVARGTPSPAGTSPAPAGSPTAAATPAGSPVGTLDQLRQQGGALAFTDPQTNDPALAIDLGSGDLVAYDAVCTHAGCTVQYDGSQRVIYCPCHGAVYDPAHGAQVLSGPAPQPLAPIKVALAADGTIYAQS